MNAENKYFIDKKEYYEWRRNYLSSKCIHLKKNWNIFSRYIQLADDERLLLNDLCFNRREPEILLNNEKIIFSFDTNSKGAKKKNFDYIYQVNFKEISKICINGELDTLVIYGPEKRQIYNKRKGKYSGAKYLVLPLCMESKEEFYNSIVTKLKNIS